MTFAAEGRDNCVVVAGAPYVYATARGQGFVMRADCSHRGGPLHLADLAGDGLLLVCPWHERKTSLTRLRAQIPAVRTGNRVTAVLPDRPRAGGRPAPRAACPGAVRSGAVREHRPMSPGLSGRPGPRATA